MKKRARTTSRKPAKGTGKSRGTAGGGLDTLRRQIDSIDGQIQDLIAERAGLAQKVAVVKGGKGSAVDFYRPEREVAVLRA
ncbi:MAG: chorismate mutase, partial [Gammaproteobacteria bacterium]|nr:chorismate mutase [Gammaproteobacteria bacterium]